MSYVRPTNNSKGTEAITLSNTSMATIGASGLGKLLSSKGTSHFVAK